MIVLDGKVNRWYRGNGRGSSVPDGITWSGGMRDFEARGFPTFTAAWAAITEMVQQWYGPEYEPEDDAARA